MRPNFTFHVNGHATWKEEPIKDGMYEDFILFQTMWEYSDSFVMRVISYYF